MISPFSIEILGERCGDGGRDGFLDVTGDGRVGHRTSAPGQFHGGDLETPGRHDTGHFDQVGISNPRVEKGAVESVQTGVPFRGPRPRSTGSGF